MLATKLFLHKKMRAFRMYFRSAFLFPLNSCKKVAERSCSTLFIQHCPVICTFCSTLNHKFNICKQCFILVHCYSHINPPACTPSPSQIRNIAQKTHLNFVQILWLFCKHVHERGQFIGKRLTFRLQMWYNNLTCRWYGTGRFAVRRGHIEYKHFFENV